MICEICGREFNKLISLQRHFSQTHNISSNKYYNKYLKRKDEGICKCGRKTKYKNISLGYHIFCSTKCQSNDAEVLTKRTKRTKGDNHWTRRTGKGPNKDKTYEELHGLEKAQKLKKDLSRLGKKLTGKNNPFYGKTHTQENRQKFRENRQNKTYEEIYGFEKANEIKLKLMNLNMKKGDWRDYWSDYPLDFQNSRLRLKILKEQNFVCGVCFKNISKKFSKNLHHINYIKKDNRRRNLIYLCVGCHSTTNTKRSFWKGYLQGLNRKIIRKKQLSRRTNYIIEKKLNLEYKQLLINRRI